jgi:hypothetical protein
MTTVTLAEPILVKQLAEIAESQHTKPEVLLNQAVRQFLDQAYKATPRTKKRTAKTELPPAPPEFLREMAAFERLKPELLKQYQGRVVAIYEEKVVEVGDDTMDVYGNVLDKLGYVPCYVSRVEEDERVLRMPSARVVR